MTTNFSSQKSSLYATFLSTFYFQSLFSSLGNLWLKSKCRLNIDIPRKGLRGNDRKRFLILKISLCLAVDTHHGWHNNEVLVAYYQKPKRCGTKPLVGIIVRHCGFETICCYYSVVVFDKVIQKLMEIHSFLVTDAFVLLTEEACAQNKGDNSIHLKQSM